MPIFLSRPNLALCLLVACLGAACGEDPVSAVDAGGAPSTGGGSEGGAAVRADAGVGTVSKGDAGAGNAGADAAQPTPADAAQPTPADAAQPPAADAAAPNDAAAPGVDAGPVAPTEDAGAVIIDAALVKPDAQASDAGAPAAIDSGSHDAGGGPAPDASGPQCIERGESCATGNCCADSVCVPDEPSGGPRCLAPCEFPERCAGCGNYCGADEGASSLRCREPILLGKDGAYLGRAASATFAPEGVCNTNSLYGNSFGTYSIHNKNGSYGNTSSPQSPYNPNNFDGPAIACPDEQLVIAYVNTAGNGFNDVDPDELCDWLASKFF